MSRFPGVLVALVCLASLAGCATAPTAKRDPRDPFERINRKTYAFNSALDRSVLRPTARAYHKVTPNFIETGVSNFFDNLSTPRTIICDLLQGKLKASLSDTGRLLLNSTLGLGGLLDPATDAGLAKNDEDFGQTFGKWGAGPGPYIVLPFLGPSDLRDGIGRFPDALAWPLSYVEEDKVRYGLYGVYVIDTRTRLLSVDDALKQAYDPYAFMRNAYLQRRQYLVTDGQATEDPFEGEELPEPDDSAPVDAAPKSTAPEHQPEQPDAAPPPGDAPKS
jgi:phospholipid-binding lipoprotein MlaA